MSEDKLIFTREISKIPERFGYRCEDCFTPGAYLNQILELKVKTQSRIYLCVSCFSRREPWVNLNKDILLSVNCDTCGFVSLSSSKKLLSMNDKNPFKGMAFYDGDIFICRECYDKL